MSDIGNIMAARNAIIQGNAALRAAVQRSPVDAQRGAQFATALVNAQNAPSTLRATSIGGTPPSDTAGPVPGFASTLSSLLARVNTGLEAEDTAAEAYERGETTDIASVMLTQQQASIQFEATLQVRNKLLTAYKDIMNMSI